MRTHEECYIQKYEVINIDGYSLDIRIDFFDLNRFMHFYGIITIDRDRKDFIFETFSFLQYKDIDLKIGIDWMTNVIESIEINKEKFVDFVFVGNILTVNAI